MAINSKQNPTQVGEISPLLKQAKAEPIVLTGTDNCMSMDGMNGHTNLFVNAQKIKDGFNASGYAALMDFSSSRASNRTGTIT